ncbi:MAG: hypothetical protein E6L02_02055 [Thaumarchaeota archaeon]|nr:MAG: hypothetical protein E6L02_02055 [Nitrososphaerota archaeon]
MVFESLNLTGIVGISLVFIAIFMLVSACSLIISWYTKSKKDTNIIKNKFVKKETTTIESNG